ncbi:MAG TPA: putative porin [Xanthomonadales bacterium]|nr:putative porin [Xanthomonadales bacterium]
MKTLPLVVALAFAAPALAQDVDPVTGEPIAEGRAVDDASPWTFFGDALVRVDQVGGLIGRDDVDQLRSRARFGLQWTGDGLEFGVAAKALVGSESNDDVRRNNQNERNDAIALDQAWVRWLPNDATTVQLGKADLPFAYTPLWWDADLRPFGASASWSTEVRELDRIGFVAGYFAGQHLYEDDSRIAAAQLTWRIREGAPTSGDVALGYVHFDDLEQLARNGLTRTNRRVGTRLVSDYELVDLQLGLRHLFGDVPFAARLDLVRNLGADDLRDAARFSVVVGDGRVPHGWEFGYAVQRIQRDAVMAAFNEDDWWFHSFARGSMPWVAYGIDERWSVRVAGFFERRDDQDSRVERLLIDLRADW